MNTQRICQLGALVTALACGHAAAATTTDNSNATLIQHGHYAAIAGDCVACHTAPGGKPFAGGLPLPTPIGNIIATNITPSKTAGIGNYTEQQFSDALRRGIRADGAHLYPAMPYPSYAQISDADVQAMYAYFMHAVTPVDVATAPTRLPFPFNIRQSMAVWNLLFVDNKPFTPDPGKSPEWNRGAYLVRGLTHCSDCHSPRNLLMAKQSSRDLAGGELDAWLAPNITSDVNSGIGGWSSQDIVDDLRSGHATGKAQAAGGMAEAIDNSLQHLTSADLLAIATYLKAVPAQHDPADTQPVYSWGAAFDELDSLRGVPLPKDANQMSGAQIYDAYCSTCHQARGQGSFDGGLPSLFHNTATGRSQPGNLVMVILHGIQWQSHGTDVRMPGFAHELSDQQIATLGSWLTRHYGNPSASVSADQVKTLRAGGAPSHLLLITRLAMVVVVLVIIAIIGMLIRRKRRKARSTGHS